MKPALTTRSGWYATTGLGDRGVPRGPVGVRAHRLDEGRDPGAFGAGEPLDAAAVRPDRDDLGRVAGLGGGVQQRLEQGAGAGDQHDDPRRYGQPHPIAAARLRHARLLARTSMCGDRPSLGRGRRPGAAVPAGARTCEQAHRERAHSAYRAPRHTRPRALTQAQARTRGGPEWR